VLAELTWRSAQNHTVELLPNVSCLLRQAGLDLRSAKGIIVAIGPGSFNGLRVGVSTAKGLAFSLGIPIVGISTLEMEAYPHAWTGLPVCPIFNAGRGEIATAIFQKQDGQWCRVTAEHITTVEALCARTVTTTLFCGEFIPAIHSELLERLKNRAVIPDAEFRLRRAGFLAGLGTRRIQAGDYDNPATLQPIYLRRPPITQPKHR
jgi:tRNA threonylcarbamoyl adenosine modification protein YeaZ